MRVRSSKSAFLVAITVGLLVCSCGSLQPVATPSPTPTPVPTSPPTPTAVPTPTPDPAILAAAACQGAGVPGAAAYDLDHVPHPVWVVTSSGEWHDWNGLLPQEWRAEDLSQVEIVACVEPGREVSRSCAYANGGRLVYYQRTAEIRLIAARTGEELFVTTVGGDAPMAGECPMVMVFSGNSMISEQYGPEPEPSRGLAAIEPYIVSAPPRILLCDDHVDSLTFSPDGSMLASLTSVGEIVLWDLATGQIARQFEPDASMSCTVLVFSPDGSVLASGSLEEAVLLRDADTGQLLRTLSGDAYYMQVQSLAFSPDGRLLASPLGEGRVVLWDVSSGQISTVLEHTIAIYVAFSPDGRYLAGSDFSEVVLWDLDSGDNSPVQVERRQNSPTVFYWPVAFLPDGPVLAYTACNRVEDRFDCTEGEVRLWDVETQRFIGSLTGATAAITRIAVSPDGQLLAGLFCVVEEGNMPRCALNRVLVWDTGSREVVRSWDIGGGRANGLAFSPDGQTLAVSNNEVITLYDMSWLQPGQSSGP